MKHVESSVKIYYTADHSQFGNISGNRFLSQKKIDKIVSDINSGLDMLRYSPIIVDDELNVIDGQHRLQVARRLKCNIWYVIADKKSLYDIARINSNTDKWKAKDFLNSYVILKNPHYIELQEFIDKYKINLSLALMLLSGRSPNEGGAAKLKDLFEKGKFEVKAKEEAEQLIGDAQLFSEHQGWRKRQFIIAIYRIKDSGLVDIKDLAEKVVKHIDQLESHSGAKEYLTALEDIYNIKARTRKVIYK